MKDFVDYLKNHGIVEDLITYYQVEENETQKIVNKIIEDFRLIEQNNKDRMNVDSLSYCYQTNVQYMQRKNSGEVYTPLSIINYILNSIGYNSKNDLMNKSIIDISCGSGSFLIKAIKILIQNVNNHIKFNENSNSDVQDYKYIISKIQKNIYGVDINPIACLLSQLNIQKTLFHLYETIERTEDNYKFPIFKIINENALNIIKNNSVKRFKTNKFDFVVGNPPYLFIRDIPQRERFLIENSNLKSNQGQYDYYQIFLELGIQILKNQGYLGYIIPDSLLALSNRKILRKYIYDHTKIKEIYHCGAEFNGSVVSNVILILQKEYSKKEREDNTLLIKTRSINNNNINKIIQKKIKDWEFKFLININERDFSILDILEKNFPKLKDLMEDTNYEIILNRGVELGKEGNIIYCTNCKKFYPVPIKKMKCRGCGSLLDNKFIQTIIFNTNIEHKEKQLKPYLESINRYHIKKNKFIDVTKPGINYKDLTIYRDRIIIRQLSENNLICATHDKDLSLTSQSFYNLKINQSPLCEFDNFYLLGLINSHLLSFYFRKSFGSYKKLFPRILIEKIKQLPIKIPETDKERKIARFIAKKVQNLLLSYDKNIQNEIDSLVFELYNINRENREYILTELKN
jgi:adenine-specific DNA-methyltransferase